MTTGLTDTVDWINESYPLPNDRAVHVAVYVVHARDGPVVIDTGSFNDRDSIKTGIAEITGNSLLKAIILTHADLPHSGNLESLRELTEAGRVICGSSSPTLVGLGEAEKAPAGGSMMIAGDEFSFLHPPLADIQHSMWIYHHSSSVLFTADGFGNYHQPTNSALTTADMDSLPSVENIKAFHEDELPWLRYVDPPALTDALRTMFDEYDTSWIAPIHGNPIAREDRKTYLNRLERAIEEIVLPVED